MNIKEKKIVSVLDKAFFSKLNSIPEKEKTYLIDYLGYIIDHLKKQSQEIRYSIPITIFDNKSLSALEAIVKYLREEHNISFVKISRLLNRSDKTIWATYQKAKVKMPSKLFVKESRFYIPISIFSERRISVLENIVVYLKSHDLSYNEIAKLLNRGYRTIVTVCNRARKKREKILSFSYYNICYCRTFLFC